MPIAIAHVWVSPQHTSLCVALHRGMHVRCACMCAFCLFCEPASLSVLRETTRNTPSLLLLKTPVPP